MRIVSTSLAISIAALLSFACETGPDSGSDLELRAGNGNNKCKNDNQCGPGTVCEPAGPGCNPKQSECTPGCHEDADCLAGEHCNQVTCITCPCPGICEPNEGCVDDGDCAAGTVCEPTGPGCGPGNECVAGCHEDADCGADEICNQVECFTCPCPGICEAAPPTGECKSDADCGPGTVCELGTGCDPDTTQCVPGCHSDADCNGGQTCQVVYCITCPCPGFCN